MSDDLITWLRQQLDEDERVAEAAKTAFWYTDGHSNEAAAFMDRFDEARVLAEVAAKRAIVDRAALYGRDLLKLLALPYAGRPGYRSEWAP